MQIDLWNHTLCFLGKIFRDLFNAFSKVQVHHCTNPTMLHSTNISLAHLLLLLFFLQAQDNCSSESFSVVIDRGELDALDKDLSSGQRTESNTIKYFEEIRRLLKVGGRYLCFTFVTVDVLDKLLDYFSSGWFFRVHLLDTETSYGKRVPLPLFCFVLTKTKFTGQC